jgi:hypothetical protein
MLVRKLALSAAVVGLAVAGTPGPASAETGPQQFRVVKIGTDTGTVVARGVITAAGREENNRLQVMPPGGPFQVWFSFPQGDLVQTISPVGAPQIDFNPTTCVRHVILQDTTEVTGGTGAYAGAHGSGVATAKLTVIGGRNADGSCADAASPPIFAMSQVNATGTLNLP